MAAKTLNDIYRATIEIDRPAAMREKKGEEWVAVTVPELRDQVRWLSIGLHSLGVKPGDRVAILAENRPEWTISDLAILCARGVSVPIYPTLLAWQIGYVINDSGCGIVIVSTPEQLAKVEKIRDEIPSVHEVVICDPADDLSGNFRTYASIVDLGREIEEKEGRGGFDERSHKPQPDDLATIIYTSGTTGNPKGVMLSHGNLTSNIVATESIFEINPGDESLSILPLSHSLQRMVDLMFLYKGVCIAYNDDLIKVADNLQAIRPQIFVGVPRLFEKMQSRILDNVAAAPPLRQAIFRWALGVGQARLPFVVAHKPVPFPLSLKAALAEKLVFSKILDRLGGRIRFVISGGAPLSAELAAFFIGAGLEIYEGYGLTETSPVITVNTPTNRKLGTVGPVIQDVEVRIAEDGEILSRGPNTMLGYFNNEEASASAIDSDRWFHTGDIGYLDEDGCLHITDRKKDIIVNAYGKNVAPQPLEGLLKTSPYIATPVLIGDRRKFLAVIIVPNFERVERDAMKMGLTWSSYEDLLEKKEIVEIFQREIDRFNLNLDRQEKVRRFKLIPHEFTIESGEITPSMKVKRKVVEEKYKEVIDGLYADEASVDTSG